MLIRAASTALAAGIVTTLLAASPIEAVPSKASGGAVARPMLPASTQPAADSAPLTPRTPAKKLPSWEIELPEDPATGIRLWTGRLVVKFRDDLKFRADAMPGRPVRGAFAPGVNRVNEVVESSGGSVRPFFAKAPSKLRSIEVRAERYSREAQPDLAGMVFVDVTPDRLLQTARAFNELPEVEWVYFEREPRPCGGDTNRAVQDGCGTNGPGDSTGFVNCYSASQGSTAEQRRCSTSGGGGGCNNPNACAADGGATPACRYGCNDEGCCDLVSGIEPTCADEENGRGWDALCATYANLLCPSTVYDTNAPIQGGGPSAAIPFAAAIPARYKYDPCFALRAPPVATPPSNATPAEQQTILIQGSAFAIPNLVPVNPAHPNPNLPSQLLDFDFCDGTDPINCPPGTVDPLSIARVPYNAANPALAPSIAAEGNPTSGIAFLAKADPSLESQQLSFSGDCLNAGAGRGCNFAPCCVAVCRTDPLCCTVGWDGNCVSLAQSAQYSDPSVNPFAPCVSGELSTVSFPRNGATPNFVGSVDTAATGQGGGARGYQLYTTGDAVLGQYEFLPAGLQPPPIVPPTQNTQVSSNPDSLGGTLAVLNSGYRGGGIDMDDYFAVCQELLGVGNVTMDDIRGRNIRVAVVDRSAYVLHEDLVNKVTAESGQTQILITAGVLNPDHGTGVLGIIGAEDNGIGVTGVAYKSDMFFYPAVSVEEGQRLQNAMVSALLDLDEGDVLCIPMDLPGPQGNGTTLASAEPYFALIQTATNAGITVVIPAGNEASPVVTNPANQQDTPDSGAIVVGACWPGTQVGFLTSTQTIPGGLPGNGYCRFRRSNFSNTETAGAGNTINNNRVHLSGWGTGCVTTGFGTLWQGFNNPPSTDPAGELQRNKLRSYSSPTSFVGTSPAAAMIAGWAACLQSFCVKVNRPTLSPRILRAQMSRYPTLADPSGGVFPQCGLAYGNGQSGYPVPPGPPALFGDTCVVGLAECELAPVGGFPNARPTVGNILAETIGGSTPVVTVVTGVLQGGDGFSLVDIDGAVLNLGAARRRAGNSGQAFGPALLYPLTGGTTDIQLQRSEQVTPTAVSQLQLLTASRISSSVPVVQLVYFYNFAQSRWALAGSAILGQGPPAAPTAFRPIGYLQDYILGTAGGGCTFYARVYTCGLGPAGYNVLHDQAVFLPTFDIFNP